MVAAAFFSLKFLEYFAVRLEYLFELSNNFDSPIHWEVSVGYFYSWGDTAN